MKIYNTRNYKNIILCEHKKQLKCLSTHDIIDNRSRIESKIMIRYIFLNPPSIEGSRGMCPRVNTTSLRIRENSRRDFARRFSSGKAPIMIAKVFPTPHPSTRKKPPNPHLSPGFPLCRMGMWQTRSRRFGSFQMQIRTAVFGRETSGIHNNRCNAL